VPIVRRLLAVCALLALTGCAAGTSFSAPIATPAPAPTPTITTPTPKPVPTGPATVGLPDGRTYVLANPASTRPRPLLIVLHGYQGTWDRLDKAARIVGRASAEGYAVAFALGVDESWNAGGCCGTAKQRNVDDIGYLVQLAADAKRRFDLADVYLLGFSAGDMMAIRALCARPDVFAAAAGAAGNLVSTCTSDRPIRYLHLHGRADNIVPFEGGRVDWLGATFAPVRDLPSRIKRQAKGSTVRLITHDCGHVWPTLTTCGTDGLGLALDFFAR
jgi:poly(3-hydroxybutyrate) depolymerase